MSEQIFRPPSNPLPPEEPGFGGYAVGVTPEQETKKRTRWILILCLLVLVVVTAAALGSRPAYRYVKAYRSRSLAAVSLEHTANGRFAEAFAAAKSAYILAGDEPATLRALALVLTRTGGTEAALPFWRRLAESPEATAEDRRSLVNAALRSGNLAEGAKYVVALGAETEDLQLVARLKLAQGKRSEAVLAARRAVEVDPANGEAQVLYGGLLLSSEETKKEGRDYLRGLSSQSGAIALRALMLLATEETAEADNVGWIATALSKHPLANDLHQLKALELQLRCNPDDTDSLLETAQERFGDEKCEAVGGFAKLLLNVKQPGRVLVVIPEETALRRRDLLILRLDALSALERWSDALELLRNPDCPIEKPLAHLFRARCYSEMGSELQAKPLWNLALTSARDTPHLTGYISGYIAQFRRDQ